MHVFGKGQQNVAEMLGNILLLVNYNIVTTERKTLIRLKHFL